ncbi:hypothetical protein SAMN04488136_13046 [Vibrio xiamenensis]|uniref:SMODS and SLOG-associating 2TM effector domain-containing protein n=1 Tax=Vibrio xiamenensis TaxID=861298 RepID=A0A1G8FG08_9VIBR|nr:hypothetical protein [Vibrio xiamenensis]SDH81091.1 hypothetical protein SAMN04488136_13046 [Vibrio xiamenensis]
MEFNEKLLIKPNIEPFDSNTQRIRRNLLVASILGLVMVTGSATFNGQHVGFLGVKLEDIKIENFYYFLLATLGYFLIHFFWSIFDDFKANKNRLTGLKAPTAMYASYAGDEHIFEPNVSNDLDSTLLSWWSCQREVTIEIEKYIGSKQGEPNENNSLNNINRLLEDINKKSGYIESALVRFERGFWYYQKSQLVRWFLLDVGVPMLLGILSFGLILCEVLVKCTS